MSDILTLKFDPNTIEHLGYLYTQNYQAFYQN